MKKKTLGLFVIIISCLSVWWWSRSTPWSRAQRALDHGEPGKAVELLVSSLEAKSWPPEKEEPIMELLARSYAGKGAIDSAEQAMRNLREKYPENFYATMGLGVISLLRDRGAFGEQYLEEAKVLDSKDIRPYLLLVRYYSYIREFKKAENNLSSGLIRFPDDDRLKELLGDLFALQGRYQDALDKYQPLLVSNPADRNLRQKVARTFFYSGDMGKVSVILNALQRGAESDYSLDIFWAEVLSEQGRRKESAAILERLYRESTGRRIAGMKWAIALAKDEKLEEAEKLLATIGESIPPLGGGYSTPVAGQTLDDLERLQDIRESARQENIFYLNTRAILSELAGRYSEAGRYLEQALKIDDRDFETLSNMSDLARLKGDPEARLKWANRAVSLYAKHPSALLLRAKVLLDIRRIPDAIIDSKIVVDSYPRLSYAQALMSKVWMVLNNPREALSTAEDAVRLNFGTPEAHLALAMAKSANGRHAEAESSFRQALDIDPRYAEARYQWGLLLRSKDRIHEADMQFQEASRLEPLIYKKAR
ncbi:MAG: tetratricopeptide repeat protein [Elusimicrobia bacterium]|nr:tetratricopeptide repeat protein [Elusimicrobiota bacterium]